MAPAIKSFSVLFILEGGFAPIYEEYLLLKNDRAIIKNGLNFYEVKILDKRIYKLIENLCKKEKFDFEETPLPTDLPTLEILINKPCKKEIKMYGVGFGNKEDRKLLNEIYNLTRNLKFKIIKETIPKKLIINYYKIDNFEKQNYIILDEFNISNETGTIEIEDSSKISKILNKLKNYNGRFIYFKNGENFYQAVLLFKLSF
ncbi:MAG: hypothetical protein ABIL76_01265 [candidate division WOR-3 bacterium]